MTWLQGPILIRLWIIHWLWHGFPAKRFRHCNFITSDRPGNHSDGRQCTIIYTNLGVTRKIVPQTTSKHNNRWTAQPLNAPSNKSVSVKLVTLLLIACLHFDSIYKFTLQSSILASTINCKATDGASTLWWQSHEFENLIPHLIRIVLYSLTLAQHANQGNCI